jgi:hypothetical protein
MEKKKAWRWRWVWIIGFIVLIIFVLVLLIRKMSRPRFLLVTIETRDNNVIRVHNENIQSYSNRYGYEYVFNNQYQNPSLNLPVYWWKLQFIKDRMMAQDKRMDYIVWLDSDTIVAHDRRLEEIVRLAPKASIFIGKDFSHDRSSQVYCAGVFMIKNNDVGKQFIDDCLSAYVNNPRCKIHGKYTLVGEWAGECYEQGVMNKLLKSKYRSEMYELSPEYVMNGPANFHGFIVHVFDNKQNVFDKIHNKEIQLPSFSPLGWDL